MDSVNQDANDQNLIHEGQQLQLSEQSATENVSHLTPEQNFHSGQEQLDFLDSMNNQKLISDYACASPINEKVTEQFLQVNQENNGFQDSGMTGKMSSAYEDSSPIHHETIKEKRPVSQETGVPQQCFRKKQKCNVNENPFKSRINKETKEIQSAYQNAAVSQVSTIESQLSSDIGNPGVSQSDRTVSQPELLMNTVPGAWWDFGGIRPVVIAQQEQQCAKLYPCDICGKTFLSIVSLKFHYDMHRKEKDFLCDMCDFAFGNKGGLENHYLVQHFKFKPYVCEICFKEFTTKRYLETHKKLHIRDEKRCCKICEKILNCKFDFEQHNLSHIGQKRHVCELCKKSFYLKCYLCIHMQSHRFLKPHVCKICYVGFTSNDHLQKHYGLEHYDVEADNICHVCNETFESKIELYDHYYVHPKHC